MISDDQVSMQDIDILSKSIDFSEFYDSSILITGATGFMGSQLLGLLIFLNAEKNANITVYALARDDDKIKRVFPDLSKNEKIHFVISDITTILEIFAPIDYIIHGASITSSRSFVEKPVETINTAYIGTHNLLEFARRKKVKGFVYLSSLEVFGITDDRLTDVTESDYGYIDILNPRSSYSESKRLCECLCASYAGEYTLPVKIARLTQVLGAGIDYNSEWVSAYFARCVIENKDIILKTDGKTLRPIIYMRDALAGIFTVMLKGQNGEAYTVANKATAITIRETAEMIIEKIADKKIKLVFDIDVPAEYAPNLNLNLKLNTTKLESLGWKAEVGIEEAYRRMIGSMKERRSICS
jgi:dTDP-glucose 4,6-dehydratase